MYAPFLTVISRIRLTGDHVVKNIKPFHLTLQLRTIIYIRVYNPHETNRVSWSVLPEIGDYLWYTWIWHSSGMHLYMSFISYGVFCVYEFSHVSFIRWPMTWHQLSNVPLLERLLNPFAHWVQYGLTTNFNHNSHNRATFEKQLRTNC